MAHDDEGQHKGDIEYTESGNSVWVIVAGIVAIAAVIFALQNGDEAKVEFLFVSATVPLSVVIVVSMALGAVLGWFVGYLRRRRKRQRA